MDFLPGHRFVNKGLALGWQDNGAAEVVGGTVFYLADVAEDGEGHGARVFSEVSDLSEWSELSGEWIITHLAFSAFQPTMH